MTPVYQMNLRIQVPGKRWHEALRLLRPLVESTRAQPECISCVLQQNEEAGEALWLVEEWSAEAPLMQHVQSDAFRTIFAAMELSVETPELRFRKLQDMGGLDLVEQARRGALN